MIRHCQRDYPNEACGYLAGKSNLTSLAIPMRNVHQSPSSYEMNPKEQLTVQKGLRLKGMTALAIYHSHVATEAYPSRRDIDRATAVQEFFDGHYVLVALKDGGNPRARAFRIKNGAVEEDEIEEISA